MCVCLLAFIFVRYEQGYDQHYRKNIYRLYDVQKEKGETFSKKIGQTKFPMASTIKSEIPGIKDFARIVAWENVPLQRPGATPVMTALYCADPSFIRMFGIKLIKGDPVSALTQPNTIVLSQTSAARLFGNTDPMGQMLRHEGRDTADYMVTAIMEDVPAQSHLQFDAIFSISSVERPGWMKDWSADWSFAYLELDDNTNAKAVEEKFPSFLKRHIPPTNTTYYEIFLQPLDKIHLYSDDIAQDLINAQKFNGNYLPLLIAVAVFVLILGIINYVNLSTSRLLTRAKEVGIRKTSGAGWKEIVMQFLSETFIFSLVSFLLALLLVIVLLPVFGRFTNRELSLSTLKEPFWWLVAVSIIVITSLLAGFLPAISMARIQPAAVLKGKLWTSYRSPLRNALVIVQFTIAIGLSMATLTAFRQLRYIQQYDMGFNKEAVIVIPVSSTNRQQEERLMERIRNMPGVTGITGALRRMGSSLGTNDIVFRGPNGDQSFRPAVMYGDFNYLSFYDITMKAGRSFSAEYGADRNGQSYVINETMARELLSASSSKDTSLAGLIGKGIRFGWEDSLGTIIGITRDFNFSSLHNRIEPLCMNYLREYFFTDLSIRIDTKKMAGTIAEVEQNWKELLPGQPFSYYFLDKYLQELYRSDTQTSIFIAIFTIIAFIVSCLGLIGVAAFNIERRTKEIGIRKVLGATVSNIVFLLSIGFVRLVFISILISIPIAWWAINSWMQGFAYHIDISLWMFLVAGMIALLIAIFTSGFQAVRAASSNPVDSIKVE